MENAVALLIIFVLRVWGLMLLIGVAHHEISDQVPALGFFATMLVVYIVRLATGKVELD